MIKKFTSTEIHFLKTGSGDQPVSPPDIYLSDLLHSPTVQFTAFEGRLDQAPLPDDKFIAAVVRIAPDGSDDTGEKAGEVFESCFNAILNKNRGIWESLDQATFALVFWDYDTEKDGTRLLGLLKEKIEKRLKADLIMGLAAYPFQDFSRNHILGNALKALDHAAFFEPGRMISFDAISLNISGDRLYQLKKHQEAIEEYKKGLQILPKDINLINSLGVAYGITGQLDKALEQFEQASAINPEEVMVIYNIGLIHRINDNEDRAMLYLKKAHGINPDIFEIELLLGYLLFKDGQFDRAIPHLDTAIGLKPESGTPFRIKGQIFLDRKDAPGAGAAFNTAVKLNPTDAAALSGYAHAMALQKKNLGIALSFAQKSVAMDPENALFVSRLEEIQDIHDQVQSQNRANAIKSA
ncbi:MAG: tetratricopeptide repeat protein [Desulfobacter sp.]|nr:MAG: tetratricopeptide repeat protein [Desulfobacter sp.]